MYKVYPIRRPGTSIRAREPRRHRIAEAVRDRQAAVAAERARRDADARRGLAALVLGLVDHSDDGPDPPRGQPLAHELLGVEVALDVAEQDPVEDVVGRQ